MPKASPNRAVPPADVIERTLCDLNCSSAGFESLRAIFESIADFAQRSDVELLANRIYLLARAGEELSDAGMIRCGNAVEFAEFGNRAEARDA